ncbi:MAG: ABC transporter ATP-binding protein [Armatimonadota bacterium]|nr:ABC transporter ATP-binding protein [Armatimonadota bacterium]MDR7428892.1 ABC transporter ATP-binding protein [Armatimonadota bacterium]MDR7431479.1 ABC transporter ATP-binding protein [Armatimonadota bacterium]MDR7514483.1 ABC transporter ATP-binding protein [Armatimonadota bacterium]MDR7525546.1 ABC transporter ATP-binding protein [Armatimonadota bacterium]
MEHILYLDRVCKLYHEGVPVWALQDVDLAVRPGEFVAVVGPSGSGKTTLLNIIGLLDRPTSGRVILAGRDVSNLSENARSVLRRDLIGFVFQNYYLLPELTVLENVLLPLRLRGPVSAPDRARVEGLLERVGLAPYGRAFPSQLSGGQQQRVALIRALANDPTLVLADEPTGNLDSQSGWAVFDLMRELNRATGKSFIMVTHDERFARQADRVVRIEDGRIHTELASRP